MEASNNWRTEFELNPFNCFGNVYNVLDQSLNSESSAERSPKLIRGGGGGGGWPILFELNINGLSTNAWNCWTNQRLGNGGDSAERNLKLLRPGEYHSECIH